MLKPTLVALTLLLASTTSALGQATRDEWIAAREKTGRTLDRVRDAEGRSARADGTVETQVVANALTLLSWRSFSDSFGDEVVVGEVQNISGATLSFSRAIFDFYYFGAYVGSDYSYVWGSQNGRLSASGIYTDVLPPGAVGFFKVWTDLPYAGITSFSFRSDAETYALAPVFTGFQIGSTSLAPNVIGGTDYAGSIRNATGSFTTFFTKVALAGYSGGQINDVDFTYVNGATVNLCGTTSTSAVAPGATVGYSSFFLRPVTSVARFALDWDEQGITPAAQSFSIGGGNGTVFIVGNCAWSAVSHVPWITITSVPNGTGDSALTFSVAPNSQGARTGTMTIAGQTFTVSQAGNVVCTFSVNFPTRRVSSSGGTGSASVAAPTGCAWSASSNAPWVVISSGASGNANGTVAFTSAPNPAKLSRTATLTIAGQDFTLTQNGRNPSGADYDGDGRTDIAIYRPSTGVWWVLQSSTNFASIVSFQWGVSTDTPVPADYDGDGRTDIAIYRPSTGVWWVFLSSSNFTSSTNRQWGVSTDIPQPGDYDGDGKADFAIYRPSTGVWWVLQSSTNFASFVSFQWGVRTDTPVPADYDGDGRTDIAIYRPSTGVWWVLQSSTNFASIVSFQWGVSTDTPVPADYDGDGRTDIAIYRPSTGVWWVLQSSTNFASIVSFQWGVSTDTPVPADYDGDGRTDIAIYRPSTGVWWLLLSSTNFAGYASYQWGVSTDIPVLKTDPANFESTLLEEGVAPVEADAIPVDRE